jgi:DNA-directed RNA polymerase specialized sigma24 family protein
MIAARLLERARAGEQDAFAELTDRFRPELHVHCYRIVGSVQDAEDLVQETLLAAWRGLEGFEGGRRCARGCTGSLPTGA